MKSKGLILLSALALVVAVFGVLTACQDNTSGVTIEESLDAVPNLSLVEGAENTDIRVNRGSDSYFSIDFSNVEWNNLIANGKRDAWCLSWKDPISSNNTVYEGIGVYSTKGDKKFAPVNRLFTLKNQIMKNDPEITWREIQVAIWSLLDYPEFDMRAIDKLPGDFVRNGQPNFDINKVENIINVVNSGTSTVQRSLTALSETENNTIEKTICVIATDSDTQTVGVLCDETAYAYGGIFPSSHNEPAGGDDDEIATCFPNVEDATENKWGWTNGALEPGEYEWPMYVGAGRCILSKGSIVGTLSVNFFSDNGSHTAEVTFDLDTSAYDISDFDFTNLLHLYVGDTAIPPSGNFAPGHFYVEGDDDYFDQELISVDQDELTATYRVTGLPNRIWVIGHIGD